MGKMPRGMPRSVPDPEGDQYDAMMQQQRRQHEAKTSVGHPGFAESLIPVWGSGREAVADFQEGDYLGASLNTALAASDLFLAGSIWKGLAKGGFYGLEKAARSGAANVVKKEVKKVAEEVAEKASGKVAKKKPPAGRFDWSKKVRPWMVDHGYLKKGQQGHHWLIPQNQWGKHVPEWLKNQPWNIKAMPEGPLGAEIHGRLSHQYLGKPKFNVLERYIHGTPTWAKVGQASVVGHPVGAATAKSEEDQ